MTLILKHMVKLVRIIKPILIYDGLIYIVYVTTSIRNFMHNLCPIYWCLILYPGEQVKTGNRTCQLINWSPGKVLFEFNTRLPRWNYSTIIATRLKPFQRRLFFLR